MPIGTASSGAGFLSGLQGLEEEELRIVLVEVMHDTAWLVAKRRHECPHWGVGLICRREQLGGAAGALKMAEQRRGYALSAVRGGDLEHSDKALPEERVLEHGVTSHTGAIICDHGTADDDP